MILTGLFIMILLCLIAQIVKTSKKEQIEKIGYKYY